MRVREIKTKVVPVLDENQRPVVKDGKTVTQIVPELDADGREIEVYSIDIPREVEAEGPDAIDAHVAARLAEQTTVTDTEETE